MNKVIAWIKSEPVVVLVGFGNAVVSLVEGIASHAVLGPLVQAVTGAVVSLIVRSQVSPSK